MKPAALIALNFVREHRWPVMILFAWIVLAALAVGAINRHNLIPDDVAFYVQEQAVYIAVFSAFLAADAIHNERKSRRLLLVLSKAVSRREYLFSVTLGACGMAFAYTLAFGLCTLWLTQRAMVSSAPVLPLMLLVMAGATTAATVALFFSTFLNPYAATALTLVLFTGPGAIQVQQHAWSAWLPGLPVMVDVLHFGFFHGWSFRWYVPVIALVESAVFWWLAVLVFERRDIAVPVE